MLRKIIKIDEEKCNGCGLCASACHEDAIQMINGKARLVSDSYCDGLGACLPACPADAIAIVEREADAFDEEAVKARQDAQKHENLGSQGCPGTQTKILHAETKAPSIEPLPCGCPGTHSKLINHPAQNGGCQDNSGCPGSQMKTMDIAPDPVSEETQSPSLLRQWPVQIKLVPTNAPYLHHANLLIAADCAAYAYANFHQKFMRNKITIIGCPKLDEGDYSVKLTELFARNELKSVTVVRMEVPCCGGIANAVKTALKNSGKQIPWNIITIGTDGTILED